MKKYVLLFLCLLMINTEIFSQDDFFEEKKEVIEPHVYLELGPLFGDIDSENTIDSKMGSYLAIGYAKEIVPKIPFLLKTDKTMPLFIELGLKQIGSKGTVFNQTIVSNYEYLELRIKSRYIVPLKKTKKNLFLNGGIFYSSLKVAEENWNNTVTSVAANMNSTDLGVVFGVSMKFNQKIFFSENITTSMTYSYGLVDIENGNNSKSFLSAIRLVF